MVPLDRPDYEFAGPPPPPTEKTLPPPPGLVKENALQAEPAEDNEPVTNHNYKVRWNIEVKKEIYSVGKHQLDFQCLNWIKTLSDSKLLKLFSFYQLLVVTGDDPTAGTDADVQIEIKGTQGQTGFYSLHKLLASSQQLNPLERVTIFAEMNALRNHILNTFYSINIIKMQ